MSQAKRISRGKRPSKAVSVLGIAGMSLAASTGGSPADIPPATFAAPTVGSVADMLWQSTAPFQIPALDDEEISDVSLATFHLFDNENPGNSGSGIQLAVRSGCGGCGCGHGGGCGGARGCGGGCGGGGGWRVGGRGVGLGRGLLLVVGRVRPLLAGAPPCDYVDRRKSSRFGPAKDLVCSACQAMRASGAPSAAGRAAKLSRNASVRNASARA